MHVVYGLRALAHVEKLLLFDKISEIRLSRHL
jgi:hypothetical protein